MTDWNQVVDFCDSALLKVFTALPIYQIDSLTIRRDNSVTVWARMGEIQLSITQDAVSFSSGSIAI